MPPKQGSNLNSVSQVASSPGIYKGLKRKRISRTTDTNRAPFEVEHWDEEEARWVSWKEQQTVPWIMKAAEKEVDRWNHPAFWLMKELELNNTAEFLWSAYLQHKDQPPVHGRPHVINFPTTSLMLAAMSVECLFKAILFCRLPYPSQREEAANITKGAHDLCGLLQKVGWRSTADDRQLLKYLSHYVRWTGRYPLPKTSSELADARINGIKNEKAWQEYCSLRKRYGRRVALSLKQWTRNLRRRRTNLG